jgi:hypothetical protein
MEAQNLRKPQSVTKAVNLLWASFAIGLVKVPMEFPSLDATEVAFISFVLIFTFAILWFFIAQISAGRNWARITFLVLSLIGLLPSLLVLLDQFSRSLLAGAVTVLQIGLQIDAMFLLFTEPGSGWFRKAASAKTPVPAGFPLTAVGDQSRLMRFQVNGVDSRSGEERHIVLFAATQREALVAARAQNIMATGVMGSDPTETPPTDNLVIVPPADASLANVFNRYLGNVIGINYRNAQTVESASLVAVTDDHFAVYDPNGGRLYHFPLRMVLEVVEPQVERLGSAGLYSVENSLLVRVFHQSVQLA